MKHWSVMEGQTDVKFETLIWLTVFSLYTFIIGYIDELLVSKVSILFYMGQVLYSPGSREIVNFTIGNIFLLANSEFYYCQL